MTQCLWCREPLTFTVATGWVHADGNLYKQREIACNGRSPWSWRRCQGPTCRRCNGTGRILVDDHCAMPVPVVLFAESEP